jgi:hypothetical protein
MRQVSNLLPEGRGDLSKRDRRPPQRRRRLDKWPARNFVWLGEYVVINDFYAKTGA